MKFLCIGFLHAILLISLSVNSAYASFTDLDEIFLDEGIVDENYKYMDKKLAAQVFTAVNNEIANSLPINIDINTRITSVFHTPNFAMYNYTYDLQSQISDLLIDDVIEYFREDFTSIEFTQDLCDELFGAKFQQVNGYTFILNFSDISGKKIIDISLDEKICPLEGY